MEPEDNENAVDLILDVNLDKSKALTSTLEKIERGQGILFNATLKSLQTSSPVHLHLVDLQLLSDFKEIPDIVVTNSRFAFGDKHKTKLFGKGGGSPTAGKGDADN